MGIVYIILRILDKIGRILHLHAIKRVTYDRIVIAGINASKKIKHWSPLTKNLLISFGSVLILLLLALLMFFFYTYIQRRKERRRHLQAKEALVEGGAADEEFIEIELV